MVRSVDELETLAEQFVATLAPLKEGATVVALEGDLGAGKTAFVKAAAKALAVSKTITSPTFVLEKIYDLKNQAFARLVHIDAYRLEDSKELEHLGFGTLLKDPHNLIMVEWADRVRELLPPSTQTVLFRHADIDSREITFHGTSNQKEQSKS